MLIIGIDPGSRFCGYGLIECQGKRITAAGCDVIPIREKLPLQQRLLVLYQEMSAILDEHKPEQAVVETIFYHKHIQAIFALGHARGIILLTLVQRDIPIYEYSPREVKKAVVGNGNATKQQVRYMIGKLLNLDTVKHRDDAADALAVAMCHFHRMRFL
ncbi:MAG: crossover junction endodeoxyribonuclease RuvC [Candidatus Cloacimonetes bacterium]|nr:crossover junction endodeoxyribonuclease RuvC [Candidatus Cloacimonadota bacterium]